MSVKIKVDQFYRNNRLRLHEIPVGKKYPVVSGWQKSQRFADEIEPLIDGTTHNKYGWILNDNHIVIDIDVHPGAPNGFESLAKLEAELGFELTDACNAIVNTPSGGRHYYFTKPPSVQLGRLPEGYPSIDVLLVGRQVVAAGSQSDERPGKSYEINDDPQLIEIPAALLDMLRPATLPTLHSFKENGTAIHRPDFGMDKRRERADLYLRKVDSAISGSKGHDTAFRGVCSIMHGFDLDVESTYTVLLANGYNERCVPPWSIKELQHKVESAAAQPGERGALLNKRIDPPCEEVDISGIVGKAIANSNPNSMADDDTPGEDDESFYQSMVPESGLLHEIFDYYWRTSFKRTNVIGLAVAVSLCETIFGRRIQSHTKMRTNDYNVVLAPTSTGKDACVSVTEEVLRAGEQAAGRREGQGFLAPPRIKSGSALLREVSTMQTALWVCDEFGKILKAVLDPKSQNSPLADVGGDLLELYSKSSGTFRGSAYADGRRNSVEQPHLCLLGITTANIFDAVNAEHVHAGLLGRIAFWPVRKRPRRSKERESIAVPESLAAKIGEWMNFEPGFHGCYPDPVVIKMDAESQHRWESHADEIDERMDDEAEFRAAIWGRVAGRAMKFALLHRAARCTMPPTELVDHPIKIEIADIEWGIKLANWLANISCGLICDYIEDKQEVKVKQIIIEAVSRSEEGVAHSWFTNKFRRFTTGDFRSAAKSLAATGVIEIFGQKTKGRKKTVYRMPA